MTIVSMQICDTTQVVFFLLLHDSSFNFIRYASSPFLQIANDAIIETSTHFVETT